MSKLFAGLTRSELMSRIRSRGNKRTELALLRLFRAHKITGWRRHQNIFGKPDFLFLKHKLAVFVDGCFWHGCRKCYRAPKSNCAFWRQKVERNRKRDLKVNRSLRTQGWKVVRFWECKLHDDAAVVKVLRKVLLNTTATPRAHRT
ncbi:MAG: DNA mismatch endonuclease Vsr [Proteobacteria bacterium]|nr:DNA mismatch endonuclease Vsr [Verrucomicrobiota bacterium]NBU09054.1 DNA mismatch endonuclease Vsr [Pseudomonadota bacterium]